MAGVKESLDRAFGGESHVHATEARGFHFETVYSPVKDRSGAVVAVSIRVADVSARETALAELAKLNATLEERVAQRSEELATVIAELERTARAKDAFLASMSHELRTPLTGILGAAELLRTGVHGPLTDQQLRSLGFLEEAGRRGFPVAASSARGSCSRGRDLRSRRPLQLGDHGRQLLRPLGHPLLQRGVQLRELGQGRFGVRKRRRRRRGRRPPRPRSGPSPGSRPSRSKSPWPRSRGRASPRTPVEALPHARQVVLGVRARSPESARRG